MRDKGFEGLTGLVGDRLKEDIKSGALFVFSNKRHTRLKVIYFDGSGSGISEGKILDVRDDGAIVTDRRISKPGDEGAPVIAKVSKKLVGLLISAASSCSSRRAAHPVQFVPEIPV